MLIMNFRFYIALIEIDLDSFQTAFYLMKRARSEAEEQTENTSNDDDQRKRKRQRRAAYMREYRAARKLATVGCGPKITATHGERSTFGATASAITSGESHSAIRKPQNCQNAPELLFTDSEVHADTKNDTKRGEQKRHHHVLRSRKYRASKKTKKSNEDDTCTRLQSLAESVLHNQHIPREELELMAKGQQFTSDPRLALAYYYCCGVHPDAFVFNDEHVRDDESVRNRLSNAMDPPLSTTEYAGCQDSAAKADSTGIGVFACASCCEYRVGPQNDQVSLPLSGLPESFRISSDEYSKRYGHLSDEIVRNHAQILIHDDGSKFFLNPELVRDTKRVHLCSKCAHDPRKSKFSIASGHEYGRGASLPELSAVARNCVAPIRCFGLELSLSGKHCSGHAICFPSTGPESCVKVLPVVDIERKPRVTFIGPSEEWRARKNAFRRLYELPSESVYSWLSVLKETHSLFRQKGITIDVSRAKMVGEFQDAIENDVIVTDSTILHAVDDAVVSERYGSDVNIGKSDDVVIQHSAVLRPAMCNSGKVRSTIIDAMIDVVAKEDNVAVVRRGAEPVVEWDENGDLFAGAFPTLFMMGGEMLPRGSFPPDLVKHFMRYYDGRFEKDVTLVATLFNQLQRHSAVRKAAKAATTHATTLKKLGQLASTPEFKQHLLAARNDPDSPAAKRLNAGLLRILSVIGDTVAFSPFERAATRPKLEGTRFRFGLPQFWITVAPPEQDDLTLHRILQLRSHNDWNDECCIYSKSSCRWEDLPQNIKESPRLRLSMSNGCPALAAFAFERKMDLIQNAILRCPASRDIKKSRNYLDRETGAYGKVAAFNGVIEPQIDGRLHLHMTVYGASITPEILTRCASCPELRERIAEWMDTICINQFSPEIRAWIQKHTDEARALPRACETELPIIRDNVDDNVDEFQNAVEKSIASTNIHTHSKTCVKGKRGKQQCRLCRPAGIHNQPTQPLHITKRNGVCAGDPVNLKEEQMLDAGYDPKQGEFLRQHISGPIVWEQCRPETDGMFVETNILLSGLTGSHCNSSVINGEDAGDMIDEYQQNYMTKEGAGLKSAATVMLTALEDALKFPSVAQDTGTPMRQAQYLATRTVNAFGGANEWSLSLMVYALLGHRSYVSSESFWYVFPRGFVRELRNSKAVCTPENTCTTQSNDGTEDDDIGEDAMSDQFDVHNVLESEEDDCPGSITMNEVIEELADLAHSEELSELGASIQDRHTTGGTRTYKINGKPIFVSQVESYKFRGEHFADYSPIEFACIVDIKPRQSPSSDNVSRGRKRRQGFDLDPRHPLYHYYEAVIRTKMLTPMFGGPAPPSCPREKSGKKKMDSLAEYIIAIAAPWNHNERPQFKLNSSGLAELCTKWDKSSASFLKRQRYRQVHNFIQKRIRSSSNEKLSSEWRARNATRWKNSPCRDDNSKHEIRRRSELLDPEADGKLSEGDDYMYWLTRAAALGNPTHRESVKALQSSYLSLMGVENINGEVSQQSPTVKPASVQAVVYHGSTEQLPLQLESPSNLQLISRRIQKMPSRSRLVKPTSSERIPKHSICGINDPLSGDLSAATVTSVVASPEQQEIIDWVLSNLDKSPPVQTLTMMHGGAGTGKSFVIHKLRAELLNRGLKTVITCPTGAAASQFPGGQTCHAAFKVGREGGHISAAKLAELQLNFDKTVGLIVTDEVSMLGAEFAVKIDKRLRLMYNPDLPFGGKSIFWSGDYLQLEALMGTPLCKVMYKLNTNAVHIHARDLLRRFRVFNLVSQQRAHSCPVQQKLLDAFRTLPPSYPDNTKGGSGFPIINDFVADAVTTELTPEDVENDTAWMEDATILVTSNVDKAALTACAARVLALRYNTVVLRWRKPIPDVPPELLDLLYNEQDYPNLFGYFVQEGRAQILDNGNGNVEWGVANGTMCRLKSLAWICDDDTDRVVRYLQTISVSCGEVIELPVAPDFLNVQLVTVEGDIIPATDWPPENNLETSWDTDANGTSIKSSIIIPIGLLTTNQDKYKVKLARTLMPKPIEIKYSQLAVELALVMTVWKAQGTTLKRVLLYLEGTPGSPKWLVDHLYVGVSRVRQARLLRCLPLSPAYKKSVLNKLRLNEDTTKWRMDIGIDGYWHPHSTDQ